MVSVWKEAPDALHDMHVAKPPTVHYVTAYSVQQSCVRSCRRYKCEAAGT